MPDDRRQPTHRTTLTRRKMLKRTLAAGVSLGVVGGRYSWRIEPHWIAVTDRPMRGRADRFLNRRGSWRALPDCRLTCCPDA
jgi:hypothetical protein